MGNWWVCLVVALVACSSSVGGSAGSGGTDSLGGSSGAGAPNGGAFAGGGPGGATNGGTANSGGLAGGGGDEFTAILVDGPAQMRGQLSIAQNSADLVNFEADVDIYFTVFSKQWDGCTRYQLGSCGYYDCPEGSNPIGSSKGDPPIYYDGGAATVTGLPPVITVTTANSNGQLFARPSQQLWPNAGGNISVAVTGGSTVPGFTMQLQRRPWSGC